MSKGLVLLLLALSCLPKLADAADAGGTPELDAGIDSVSLVLYLMMVLLLMVGGCCGWAGLSLGRRLGRQRSVRSAGTMTEALIPLPPPSQPLPSRHLNLRRGPETVWTTSRAGTLPGVGCFHVDERCGGLSNAGGLKSWRRCLRPECGGATTSEF